MSNSASVNFLRDLGPLLVDLAARAKADAASADPFAQGRAMGLYEAVSLLQQQAQAFDVRLEDLGLDGFDADRDLL
ncbi:hypothetical protein [Nocardioides sp. TF02-7]|uniref:hypothetical protein n=1 Tax=Nocardioides sp. TF02-7 TaxID=2917724 RepID=UPI001F05A4BA|nr:hypothetical protein [Nocardioides sp. TF02-7]UMG92865.1 hypothetical protein MF408_00250 [Nocardioides sp. TF02-7]